MVFDEQGTCLAVAVGKAGEYRRDILASLEIWLLGRMAISTF